MNERKDRNEWSTDGAKMNHCVRALQPTSKAPVDTSIRRLLVHLRPIADAFKA